MSDLAGGELPLTQEFMAQMMGVRRTSVTSVARQLQKEGLIFYHRGKVIILSMDLVQKRACECHHAVYVDRFGSPDGVAGPSDSARLIVYNFGFIEDCRMPVYYFQQEDNSGDHRRPEGSELPDLPAAREYAVACARVLLANAIRFNTAVPVRVFVVGKEGHELLTVFMAVLKSPWQWAR
jgi:hypothetical protein